MSASADRKHYLWMFVFLLQPTRTLKKRLSKGTFREDLFYRLNVVPVEIPPLRKRREDIAPLLEYYLQRFSKDNKRKKLSFSKEAWDALLRYDYPGNVRELENIVQRSVIMSRGEHITTEDLPQLFRSPIKEALLPRSKADSSLTEQVEQLEKDSIFEALRVHNNNQSKAAKQLGISERNLRYRLKKWGVK